MINRFGILLLVMLTCSCSMFAAQWKRLMIGEKLVVRVEIVTTSREQTLGLGERVQLPEGNGMLFVYDTPGERIFWMKRMRIPIDILWIRQGQIVFIEHRVAPPSPITNDRFLKRYGSGILADMVLELPSGYSDRHSILPGQPIRLTP